MQQTAWIDTARRMCLGVFAMLIGIELVTGLLLGLLYEPSRMPATIADGRTATVIVGERVERVGPFTDTVGTPSTTSLVPSRAGELVPSAAAASVQVQITNAPGGAIARAVHHTLAGWLVVLACMVVVLSAFARAYQHAASTWVMSIGMLIVALAAAWTGRMLPDDVYAEVSLRIVGHELLEAPLGDVLVAVLGIVPGEPMLARTYFVHILVGAASVWLAYVLWRERQHVPLVVGAGLAVAIMAAIMPIHAFGARDAVTGLAGTVQVDPWWVIRPLHELVGLLGAELAGYVMLGGMLVLVLLPVWRRP
jgi:hypothetical protein